MNVLVVQRHSLVAGADFSLSVHARIIEAMDWLRDQGMIQYAVCGEQDESISRVLRWADAVMFSKHFSDRAIAIAREARHSECLTLLDLDDLVTAFPSYSGGAANREQAEFETMLGLADYVTVANSRLMESILPLRGDCVLAPNGMYAEKYPSPLMADAYPPRCVFTNADYLKIHVFKRDFIRLLQDFHDAHPEVGMDFFGDPFPELASLPFVHYTRRIPYAEYMHCLARNGYCFALTPLGAEEDAESLLFNRCKNPFKFLNYGIAGVPGIYSDCDIYRDCVEHKRTGLLAKNTYDEWYASMELLLADARLRDTIRNYCYQTVCSEYHIRHAALQFHALLQGGKFSSLQQKEHICEDIHPG